MKKIFLMAFLVLFITGCTSINNSSTENLINEIQKSKTNLDNTYRQGYKYYLPTHLQVKEVHGLNEIITHHGYKYYIYVDLVSYFDNIKKEYKENPNSYYSKNISYDGIEGYVEINSKKDKYLIEIMYNYAKIEVIVDSDYINEAIVNSMIILSTIKYNDDIIENMMGENILNSKEEQLNIFEVRGRESKFLEYLEEYDSYEDELPDPDLIN